MVAAFSNSNGGWITAEEAEVGYTADYFGMNVPPWGCSYWYQSNPYAGFWTLIECAKVAGACCLPDHSCSAGSPDDCTSAGGVYQGHGTTCAQVNCAPPTGACCRTDGTCLDTTQANCATLGGTFHAQASCAITDCTQERYSNTIASPYTYFYSIAEYADDLTLAGSGPGYLIHYDVKVYRPSGGGSYSVTAALHTGCPPTTGNQIAGTVFTWNGLAEGNVLTLNANFPPVSISGTVWLRLQFSATDAGWIIAEQAEIGSTQNIFAAKAPNWGCNAWLGGSPWAGFWANLTFGGGLDVPSEPSAWVESEIPEVAPAAVQPQLWNAGSEPIPDDQPLRVAPPENLHVLPLALHGMASDQSRSGTVTLYLNSPVAGQTIAAAAAPRT